MQFVYIVVLGLHVMAGVFWAGTTITLARDPEIRAERFFRPQMGSAGMVFLTGALLWYFFHGAYFGSMEMVLALGIIAAFAAAGVLGAVVGSASRRRRRNGNAVTRQDGHGGAHRSRVAGRHRAVHGGRQDVLRAVRPPHTSRSYVIR